MARKDFHHPFEPYDIQQVFMKAVYDCIEDGKVGIFESPTGTGKSLSLICASLTWLREHKRRTFEDALSSIQLDDDDPEWMIEHAVEERRKAIRHLRTELEARLDAVRKLEQKLRERSANGEPPLKRRKQIGEDAAGDHQEENFVLDDYESDHDEHATKRTNNDYSSETMQMMQKLGMVQQDQSTIGGEEIEEELKIFFCSRTHSQLSQFVGELQRVKLPPGLPPESETGTPVEELKHLTLGSRKNLCLNASVTKLKSQTAINERCVELQQPSTPADQKCPFLPDKESQDTVLDFRDHALAKIRDIEDLAAVGSKLGICPYYASRPAIEHAEIVTLPYPLLLQSSAREALGISLRDHVVIIDEAHNLIDAVEGIHSSQITSGQLAKARERLMAYLQKFRNRLKGSNRAYVTQLVRVIDSLLVFTSTAKENREAEGVVEPAALLARKGADQVNITKLVRYINDSKLARKVDGFVSLVQEHQRLDRSREQTRHDVEVPTLTQVQNFLVPLMNLSKEGRFFWARESDLVTLKYLLLDPSEHFRDVVESAQAVILAGGTMSPMDDYQQQLFPYLSSIRTLSCGHLIPTSNLLVRPVAADQDGSLEFSFKSRSNANSAMRVGRALEKLAPLIRGGLVVFFPSYGYLDEALTQWRNGPQHADLIKIKPVFVDSRTSAAEDTFRAYSKAIVSGDKGAILLSVIGGKLSEGINFSDDLGRCVLVVGLPFPNLNTPEWKAKMEYIGKKAVERGEAAGKASREHAENVCMRSVNQAIGRVIRHKNDWASILLMDSRYTQPRISGKLPGWIKESLPATGDESSAMLESVEKDVAAFFLTEGALSSCLRST